MLVTHDIDEAIKLGDRIAILNVGGVLEQYDPPDELLRAPANEFVGRFLGEERGLKRLSLIPSATATWSSRAGGDVDRRPSTRRRRDGRARGRLGRRVSTGTACSAGSCAADLDGATTVAELPPAPFLSVVTARRPRCARRST